MSHLAADLVVRRLLRLHVRVVLVVRLRAQREVRGARRRHACCRTRRRRCRCASTLNSTPGFPADQAVRARRGWWSSAGRVVDGVEAACRSAPSAGRRSPATCGRARRCRRRTAPIVSVRPLLTRRGARGRVAGDRVVRVRGGRCLTGARVPTPPSVGANCCSRGELEAERSTRDAALPVANRSTRLVWFEVICVLALVALARDRHQVGGGHRTPPTFCIVRDHRVALRLVVAGLVAEGHGRGATSCSTRAV